MESSGSFSVTGTKQFEMPHPKPDLMHTHVLRHGAVESPTAGDTLYRYFISLKGNEAMIRTAGLSNYVIVPIEQKTELTAFLLHYLIIGCG